MNDLLFLNGMYKGKESWIKQIRSKKLKEKYRMIFMDYPEFGTAELHKDDKEYMHIVMENIYSLLQKQTTEKINLIGYSIGGVFASWFASLYPEKINSLVLINSGFYLSTYMKVIIRQSLKLIQSEIDFSMIYPYISVWNYSEEYLEKIIELPNYSNPYNDGYKVNRSVLSGLLHVADELDNYKECIEKIRCPVLAIGAENDSVLPFERQLKLFKNRNGFEVKIVSGSSHSAIYENSNEVNAYIQEFLDRYN